MLFPTLKGKKYCYIDLDKEAHSWLRERRKEKENPLLDPVQCQRFVQEQHKMHGVDFFQGGYLEDRRVLWRGSYLDEDDRYIHLGIDFSVPAGTPVAAERDCVVLRVDDDYPEPYGWGTRVIIEEYEHKTPHLPRVVLLFAHLDPRIQVTAGDHLTAGTIIGKVGKPPFNGNWFPHLHLQTIAHDYYRELLLEDFRDLDGYARIDEDLSTLEQRFPHPWDYISL